jgi:1-acyl-sn-glycerol-3-phosphate acyltransferase
VSSSSPASAVPDAPRASVAYRTAAALAMAPITLQRWRLDVEGLEHVPRSGGAVMIMNHSSFVDFFTVGRAPFLELDRPVRILAKASLFRSRLVGPAMRAAGHIPVERGAGASALRAAVHALERGELVGVLPEQTISPSFELLPFKSGAVRMAQRAGVPVVPAVSWGSHRFWTTGDGPHVTWRLPVTVRYDAPVLPGPDDDADALTVSIRERMVASLDAVQRAYRDGLPAGARWVPARLGGSAPTLEEAESMLARLRSSWGRSERQEGAA